MKKFLMLFFIALSVSVVSNAQTTKPEHKTKAEHTSTIPQKVHNAIHPKHKKYSGYKVKHKVG